MPVKPKTYRQRLNRPRQEDRPNATQRGYNAKWQQARKHYLSQHPVCVSCGRLANVVDHVIPHKGDCSLFWDTNNWQSLCEECHNIKTGRGE